MSRVLLIAVLAGACGKVVESEALPPQIVSSYAEDGETIWLSELQTNIWVQIHDEDPDALIYEWDIDGDRLEHTITLEGAQVTVERRDFYDESTLRCLILDRHSETEIAWRLKIND